MRLMLLLTAAVMTAGSAIAQEPPRAPGASDAGTTSTPSDTAGTTTTYAPAPSAADVPWPCAQRKVGSISAGTIWSGPDLAQGADWDQDMKLAALAQKLASRRTDLTEAEQAIADFAKDAGADKDKQLTKLFVGVLDIINDDRNKILHGITRYAAGQQRLAERLREESDAISSGQDAPNLTFNANTSGKAKEFEWDQRIFSERRQALSYVCETPTLLERRAFDIARRIQAQL
ncbi:hypothetical protein [Beijerinckia sp. L45]|uniref:hypothetical protein n=1 Tax=Beijerinckia sp. L45 TaxID=1641855 RepID=UPI00131CD8A0|nr:hypothetical protein [Beijerinckia sp. L45]